jgi:hypothetical protein
MGIERLSKPQLLAAAQALLDQDNRERARSTRDRSMRSTQPIRRSLITAILFAVVACLGIASFIAVHDSRTSPPAPPAARTSPQVAP